MKGSFKPGNTIGQRTRFPPFKLGNAYAFGNTNHLQHGHRRGRISPTYGTWVSMNKRCHNPFAANYARYGGLGIAVCAQWRGEKWSGRPGGFERFLADVGERPPGTTIDRYPDPMGNYEPGNVRWATSQEQRANRRRVILEA